MGAAESTERTRAGRRERGGSRRLRRGGVRTVRQRNPTWALRWPAFPSLKYYSVRVKRREREPLAREPSPPFDATINVLSPPPRRASYARSRSPRGCFVALTHTVLLFIFRSLVRTVRLQIWFVPLSLSVRPSVHSFVSWIQSEATRGGPGRQRKTSRRHWETRDYC